MLELTLPVVADVADSALERLGVVREGKVVRELLGVVVALINRLTESTLDDPAVGVLDQDAPLSRSLIMAVLREEGVETGD
jgi:hypothetical protein